MLITCGQTIRKAYLTRLDRFLIPTDWEEVFSSTIQFALPRVVLDHMPILLGNEGMRSGKSPLRFENI